MTQIDPGGRAVVKGGEIIITVPIEALQTVVDGAHALGSLDTRWMVTAPDVFARDLIRALNDEDEQGTTPIHRLFDAAINEALEQGAEGIEEHPEQDH